MGMGMVDYVVFMMVFGAACTVCSVLCHAVIVKHACLVADIASRVKYGQQTFLRFPENLLNSRARYAKAFQVGLICLAPYLDLPCFPCKNVSPGGYVVLNILE